MLDDTKHGAQSILYFARKEDVQKGFRSCEFKNQSFGSLRHHRVAIDGHSWSRSLIQTFKKLYSNFLGVVKWVVDIVRGRVIKVGSLARKVFFVVGGLENSQKDQDRDEQKAKIIADV